MLLMRKKSPRNLKSEAAKASGKKPSALTGRDKKIIAARMAEIKTAKGNRRST